MPTRTVCTNQQLLDYSEEHLLYELQLFRWIAENLPRDDGFPLSALLESFAIHLRNLVDFFYTQPVNARNDDLVAADFFDPPSAWNPGGIPKSLADARERANKEVSHITYRRKSGSDPTKPWPVSDLFDEVYAVSTEFAAAASSTKLHPRVKEWLASDTVTRGFLLASASTTSSNTVASVGSWGAAVSGKKTP
jgi:hypothetical protein